MSIRSNRLFPLQPRGQISQELLLALATFLAVLLLLCASLNSASTRAIAQSKLLSDHAIAVQLSSMASGLWLSCSHCSYDAAFPASAAGDGTVYYGNASAKTMAEIEGNRGFIVHATPYEPI